MTVQNTSNIAVLLTCHNRKKKTITCLEALFANEIPNDYSLEVFLVDDGSIDGTSDAVKEKFPDVKILQGTGNLYWNGGMRLAWQKAIEYKITFDFYLWLNDDTILFETAIKELIMCSNKSYKANSLHSLIIGTCQESLMDKSYSYGGKYYNTPIIPNGIIQECNRFNGNIVLVSAKISNSIGILSSKFTHGMGDFEYAIRAITNNYKCYITTKYIGTCENHKHKAIWCNSDYSLKERWHNFNQPIGLNIREYKYFVKLHNKNWIFKILQAYLKLLCPRLYHKLLNMEN